MKKKPAKQRGRPLGATGNAKTELIQVRVSALEKQGFEQAASDDGLSLAAWIRQRLRHVCREDLQKNGRRIPFLSGVE
jgi:hypothetical protein